MSEIMFADGLISGEELEHYGIPRRSGRYPWGSGENPYHHGASSPFGRRNADGSKMRLTDKQKTNIKRGAVAAGTALAVVGMVYLAKSGKLDTAAELGKKTVDIALSRIGNSISERREERSILKERKAASKNRRKLSDEELIARIGRLKQEKELRDLTRDDLYSGSKEARETLLNSGKKILGTATAGAGVVGMEYLLRKYFNDEMSEAELAKAIKDNMRPKKK